MQKAKDIGLTTDKLGFWCTHSSGLSYGKQQHHSPTETFMEPIHLEAGVLMASFPTIMILGTPWRNTKWIHKYHLSVSPEGLQAPEFNKNVSEILCWVLGRHKE